MLRGAFTQVPWRRGLPLTLVMAVALPLAYLGRSSQWLGVWSETQSHIGTSLIFGLPAAAGLGAWIGASNKRSGLDQLQAGASREPIQIALREYGETVLWVGLGYVVGALPAVIMTSAVLHVGRPQALSFLAQLACVGGVTATAQLAGRYLPWFLGAPICAVATYIVLGFLEFKADSLLVALTPIDERWMTFHRLLPWVLGLQIVVWALIFVHAVFRKAGSERFAFAAILLAGVVAAPLLYTTPDTRVADDSSVRMRCATHDDVTVCLPVAKGLLLPGLVEAVAENETLLAGLLPRQVAYIDDEARGVSPVADQSIAEVHGKQTSLGRSVILFSEAGDLSGYTQLDRSQFHFSFASYIFPVMSSSGAGSTSERIPLATPSDVLQRWYLTKLGLPIDGTGAPGAPYLDPTMLDYRPHAAQVKNFEAMKPEQRAMWFTDNGDAIRAGELAWSDFDAIER